MSEEEGSEEKEFKDKRTFFKEIHDKSEKLKLTSFHRPFVKQKRKPTHKKKLRDIQKLQEFKKEHNEEISEEKKKELKEIKKELKKRREAEKFELRYKKIKFFEKKKVIKQLERLKAQLEKLNVQGENEEKKAMQNQLQTYKNYLTYINNYPQTWKYISLFPKNDSEEGKRQRQEAMEKILKMVKVKQQIRENELMEEDVNPQVKNEEKKKPIDKKDAFFKASKAEQNSEEQQQRIQPKQIVMRDGTIKQVENRDDKNGFKNKQRRQQQERKNKGTRQNEVVEQKKINIKASSYRAKANVKKDSESSSAVPKHIKL